MAPLGHAGRHRELLSVGVDRKYAVESNTALLTRTRLQWPFATQWSVRNNNTISMGFFGQGRPNP